MKRVLVTGGAGFVGSHLCERLVAEGCEVVCLDDLSTGSLDNVAHLAREPKFSILRQDVAAPLQVEADEIYNLACPASPTHYQADPVRTMRTSVLGAMNVLELARRSGARVFQASTSEVYGDPSVHPQPETYWGSVNPIGPRACYDEGKRCAETLFFDYHRQYGVEIKAARIFNTYGPRMAPGDGRVVSNFVVQALSNRPITLYGDGVQTRSFCFVDDLVEGVRRLMDSAGTVSGPVNLGNPHEISMLDLAQMVIGLTGSRSALVHLPLPTDDPRQRRPDIARARALLDWTPQVGLVEGLTRTIADVERRLVRARPA